MPGRQHRVAAGAALLGAAFCGAIGQGAAEDAGRQFRDDFAGGKPELTWRTYSLFGEGVVEGQAVDSAPDGDSGIGVLRHPGDGAGTVSYAETVKAEDSFALGAEVYCPLEGEARDGALTGLAFFVDPGRSSDPEEGGFYRFVCDHRFGDASFSLAYVGAKSGRQPLELERWPLIEQPAPTDADDGWHSLEVRVEQGLIDLYLNGGKLNERPLPVERVITDVVNVDAGYAGVYAGHLGTASPAEARIDGFVYRVP
jgi:hypothetical protein